ncbi:hypothetical protein SEA_CLUBPENGUIN_13 [Streptomyces phage ClubPenguin]|nr:hypothetical protein SEA_CLUBPENGUIN_13 [Streptomyces phage ClubPenguin]
MARYFGKVGYGTSVETKPGIWEDVIVEKSYSGDVFRAIRQLREGERVNGDLSVNNSISIVADAYANANFMNIRYVEWVGTLWTVSDVEVRRPRLLLTLGGVYNGPKGTVAGAP